MIQLYNDDCFAILSNLKHVDYVFTSPPYNRKRNDKYSDYDDNISDYYLFLKRTIDICLEISDYTFLNVQKNYYNKQDVFKIIGEYSEQIVDILCWAKSNPLPASGKNITNSYEFILILSKTKKSIKAQKTYTKNLIETEVYSKNPYKKIHHAVMNPKVADWFIERFTQKDETIVDPFMGIGTTGVECIKNDRNFIGMEISPLYFDIAKHRISEVSNASSS